MPWIEYILPIITLTRAGIAAGLPLLVGLIALRLISAYERSDGDPLAIALTVAGLAALVLGLFSLAVLINRHRLSGAQVRRHSIEKLAGARWLADVTIDPHSRGLLGVSSTETTRTFALVGKADLVELWATGSGASASVERTEIERVEASPMSWSWNAVSAIVLEMSGLSEPILLDVVGPLFGTFPATAAHLGSIVEALPSRDVTS